VAGKQPTVTFWLRDDDISDNPEERKLLLNKELGLTAGGARNFWLDCVSNCVGSIPKRGVRTIFGWVVRAFYWLSEKLGV
jgi:hypothetical protein